MKLIWHIFKKDFVHLRLALGLWVLLLGGELFFYRQLLTPAGADPEWFARTQMYAGLFSLITYVVCYLMMAGLVLEDPAVGTRMFWATRPISGGRLLGAKLLGILLLFGVLPILVRLPWWLYCGYGWRELGWVTVPSLSIAGLLAIPAVVLAALSGQSSRFLLFSLLTLIALPMATVVVVPPRFGAESIWELEQSRIVLFLLICGVSGSVAAVVQFLTRRLVRSVVILGVGVGLGVLCLFTWPWRLDRLAPENRTQLAGTEPISVKILNAEIFPANKGQFAENTPVSLTLGIENLPENMVLLSGLADVELRWPAGFTVRQQHLKMWPVTSVEPRGLRRILALPSAHSDPETTGKLAELREERLRRRPPVAQKISWRGPVFAADEAGFAFTLFVTPDVAARIKAEPPACSVSVRLIVGRPEVLFEMPLRDGARQSGKGARLHVLNLEDEPRGKDGLTDPLLRKFTLTLVSAVAIEVRPAIFRVDRERGVFEQIQGGTISQQITPLMTKIQRTSGPLSAPRLWRTDKWIDDPGWLPAQTLAVVNYREAGGFNRDIHVDRLPLRSNVSK